MGGKERSREYHKALGYGLRFMSMNGGSEGLLMARKCYAAGPLDRHTIDAYEPLHGSVDGLA
jgi:hypothetical protein